mmetsp:Transcript_36037/g.111048  ORF Transcript_36037/g.111048 Transcript_36037/m.111048 type:complete len:214 (+) Transcript_36037:504-1145(+)
MSDAARRRGRRAWYAASAPRRCPRAVAASSSAAGGSGSLRRLSRTGAASCRSPGSGARAAPATRRAVGPIAGEGPASRRRTPAAPRPPAQACARAGPDQGCGKRRAQSGCAAREPRCRDASIRETRCSPYSALSSVERGPRSLRRRMRATAHRHRRRTTTTGSRRARRSATLLRVQALRDCTCGTESAEVASAKRRKPEVHPATNQERASWCS